MAKFTFDPAVPDTENIERFFKELEAADAEMAALLRTNIGGLIPFPAAPEVRQPRRQAINEKILAVLDKMAEKEPSE